MKLILISATLSTGALALAVQPKRHANSQNRNIEARHGPWKSHSWYGIGYETGWHGHHRTVKTVTITVTVTATIGPTFPNATTTDDSGAPATSLDDLAPITLIDLSSAVEATVTDVPDVEPIATATDDLAPVTLIDISSLPGAPEPTSAGDAGAVPTPNDIAPVTLITLAA